MVIDVLNKFLTKHTNYKLEKIQPDIEEKIEKKESNKKNPIDERKFSLEYFTIIYSNFNSNIEAFAYINDFFGDKKIIIIKRKNSKWENIYCECHTDSFSGDDGLRYVEDCIEAKILNEEEISEIKNIISDDRKALITFMTYLDNMHNTYDHSFVDRSSFTPVI